MSRPNDPNTKPSRTNRRRKKRWKISGVIGIEFKNVDQNSQFLAVPWVLGLGV